MRCRLLHSAELRSLHLWIFSKEVVPIFATFLASPTPTRPSVKMWLNGSDMVSGALLDNTLQVQRILPEGRIGIISVELYKHFSESLWRVMSLFLVN